MTHIIACEMLRDELELAMETTGISYPTIWMEKGLHDDPQKLRNSLQAQLDALPENKLPSACIGCRKCTKVCPQNIDIPNVMKGLVEEVKKHPTWKQMSEQRAREAEELRKKEQ